jgi:ADP-ribose pyrophosphatase YjhB (NUDIX family)
MVGTGFVVVSPENEVLIVRQEHKGTVDWGFNGGALEAGETIEECAIREAREELGIEVRLIRLISVAQVLRDGELHGVGFTFLATPEPWPQQIRLGSDNVTSFLDYRWITREEYETLQGGDDYDFWELPWPAGIVEPLLRRIEG